MILKALRIEALTDRKPVAATISLKVTLAKSCELAKCDRLPDLTHSVKVEGQIMVGAEGRGKHLSGIIKMADIGS